MYERFLSQLSWNLVEVAGEHEKDGTIKYDISTSAKIEYGLEKDERPTFGHQKMYGTGNVVKGTAPSNTSSQPRLTMAALAQHQQQQLRQQTEPADRQPMQSAKPLQPDCESVGGGSMALTAEALAKLDIQESQKAGRVYPGKKQQAAAEQEDKDVRKHDQGGSGWNNDNNADIEEEDDPCW